MINLLFRKSTTLRRSSLSKAPEISNLQRRVGKRHSFVMSRTRVMVPCRRRPLLVAPDHTPRVWSQSEVAA